MELDQAFKRVAVLGAAGKMGSGISLLLLQEMARLEAVQTGEVGKGEYKLILIDPNEGALDGLRQYLKTQISRYAEKNINTVRGYYSKNPDLVSNEEIIRAFTDGALDIPHYHTHLDSAKGASLVFEAIVEDAEIKARTFRELAAGSKEIPWFFTNTSSIPIHILDEKGSLNHHIIGYHFYNPPAVQRLLEIIVPEKASHELRDAAGEIARRLQKKVVHSHDIAGFIGNGLFIREIVYAIGKVAELMQSHTFVESVYTVDKATRDLLIRPMGIFQLLDYVGIDVAQKISRIMSTYLPENDFRTSLIDEMVSVGVVGGQRSDGSQKNGFFEYLNDVPQGVYELDKKRYVPLPAATMDKLLGNPPEGWLPWKKMQKEANRNSQLKTYLQRLFQEETLGATIAKGHLIKAREIARNLVKDGVADKIDDVNTVMENGFFHLYGPDSPLIPQAEVARSSP